MGKWLGVVAVAAVLALGGPVARPAAADDMNMNGGATCAPDGTSLTLTAHDHAFDKNCLAVPAGVAFTIRFDNRDADRHNVAILPSHMSTDAFFRGDIVPGPKSIITYSVPALKAGTWHFHCEIHPNLMNGTFIVAAAPAAPAAPAPAPTSPPKATPTPPPGTALGGGMPVLTPTPTTASAPSSAAAPAPAPAAATPKSAAAAPKSAAAPPPARTAAGAAGATPQPGAAAAAGSPLPRTGPASDRLLLLLAGTALALGGLSIVGAARRSRPAAIAGNRPIS